MALFLSLLSLFHPFCPFVLASLYVFTFIYRSGLPFQTMWFKMEFGWHLECGPKWRSCCVGNVVLNGACVGTVMWSKMELFGCWFCGPEWSSFVWFMWSKMELSGGVSFGEEPRLLVGRISFVYPCCPPESQGTPRLREIVLEGSNMPARQG